MQPEDHVQDTTQPEDPVPQKEIDATAQEIRDFLDLTAPYAGGERRRQRRRGKRRRGAPLGNQNARKHGLYARALTPEQIALLPQAREARHLEQEVVVMRVKLVDILANADADPDLQLRAMRLLAYITRVDDRLRYGT